MTFTEYYKGYTGFNIVKKGYTVVEQLFSNFFGSRTPLKLYLNLQIPYSPSFYCKILEATVV